MKLDAAIVVMMLGGSLCGLGCSHAAKPVEQPAVSAPLPPASGTPIGHLVDNASELKLSEDQITKLKEISDQLATQLVAGDNQLRPAAPAPPDEGDDAPKGRGLGFGGAGGTLRHTPDGGGMLHGPTGGAAVFPGAVDGHANSVAATTVGAVHQQRAHQVRDALRRAFQVIDADQQAIARRLLVDHGIDPDSGEEAGGNPGETTMEDPKLGQPLPREQ